MVNVLLVPRGDGAIIVVNRVPNVTVTDEDLRGIGRRWIALSTYNPTAHRIHRGPRT